MKPPLDTYQHPFKSSARRLPDIAEVPQQDQHDQRVPACRCHGFTEHCPRDHHESKCTSSSTSRAPNRTSLMSLNHYHISKTQSRTLAGRGAAKFFLTIIVVGVFVVVMSAMAYMVASLSHSQAHLLKRVTSLEHRLAEVDEDCECGRGETKGERGQENLSNGERRNNKFAFIMTRGHAKLLEGGETDSKPVEDRNPLHELKEVLDTVTPEIHPKVLIRLEEARSTLAPPKIRDPASTNSAPSDDSRASSKGMPVISQHSERTGRFKRGSKRRGKSRNTSEEPQRARAVARPGDSERNSTEIKGVHFQANLNRTTTIGVGWVPYWALSSSILNTGSSDRMDEIKSEFRLSARGNVTVRTPGLYYVYSQMMYYDPNEYIGHSIVIDGVEAFTCIAPISGQTSKYKTCFIGGLVYIPPRAKVGIKMLYAPRRVCLFEDTSYFGMFRVT